MNKVFKVFMVVISLAFSFQSRAQWVKTELYGGRIYMLKHVNDNLFAYAFDFDNHQSSCLYKSSDVGAHWQRIDSVNFWPNDITYDSVHNIYLASAYSVYSSTDGITWLKGTDLSYNGITYIHNQIVASTGSRSVAISTDGGINWNASDSGLAGYIKSASCYHVTRIADTLYLAGFGPFDWGGSCFISGDYGATWQLRDEGNGYRNTCFFQHNGIVWTGLELGNVAYYQDGHWIFSDAGLKPGSNINALADAGDRLFGGGPGVWMKNDTSNIWVDFSCGLPPDITVYKLVSLNGNLFAGTSDGLWRYDLSAECINTGVETIETNSRLNVYPSITSGPVHVYSDQPPVELSVMNMQGQILQTIHTGNILDVSCYPVGLYFISAVLTGNETVVRKIVKE